MKLLAISGSLRAASVNTRLLKAVRCCAPPGMTVELYAGLGSLPLFNPDLEDRMPAPARRLRKEIEAVDGIIIASPEYAHGVTGAIKNCLDWLVGGHEFVQKPVAVLNAAPRAHHALDALKETIRTMNGRLVEEASLLVPVANRVLDAEAIATDTEFRPLIETALAALGRVIEAERSTRHREAAVRFMLD